MKTFDSLHVVDHNQPMGYVIWDSKTGRPGSWVYRQLRNAEKHAEEMNIRERNITRLPTRRFFVKAL